MAFILGFRNSKKLVKASREKGKRETSRTVTAARFGEGGTGQAE